MDTTKDREQLLALKGMRDKHKLYIGSFYRPPTNDLNSQSAQVVVVVVV